MATAAILKIVEVLNPLGVRLAYLPPWRSRQIGKVTILSRWIFCGFDARLRFLLLYEAFYSLIAQLAEHGAVNSGVPGSSPGGGVEGISFISGSSSVW